RCPRRSRVIAYHAASAGPLELAAKCFAGDDAFALGHEGGGQRVRQFRRREHASPRHGFRSVEARRSRRSFRDTRISAWTRNPEIVARDSQVRNCAPEFALARTPE